MRPNKKIIFNSGVPGDPTPPMSGHEIEGSETHGFLIGTHGFLLRSYDLELTNTPDERS